MNREEKKKQAEALHEELKKAKSVILSKFEGLTVAQDTELRRKIAATGSKYKVVKNTLIERAAQGTLAEAIVEQIAGTTSLAYTESDPAALAKALSAYAKENPALIFKVGIVEGRVISLADLGAIASLPKKEELLSKVLFLINAPAQRLAYAVSGVAQKLAAVIHQAVKENKFGDAAAAHGLDYEVLRRVVDAIFAPAAHARLEPFLRSLRALEIDLGDTERWLCELVTVQHTPTDKTVPQLYGSLSPGERSDIKAYAQGKMDEASKTVSNTQG